MSRVHVVVLLRSLTVLDDFILVVREVHLHRVAEIRSNLILPVDREFPTLAVNDTEVRVRRIKSEESGNRPVLSKDVGTMLTIVVKHCTQAIVEEVHVETIVLLKGLLPADVRVVLSTLIGTLCSCTVLNTENIGEGRLVHTGIGEAVEGVSLVDDIRVSHIHESVTTDLIVTDQTP